VQTFVVADASINDLHQSKARIAEDRLAAQASGGENQTPKPGFPRHLEHFQNTVAAGWL
jgi:hypothetical protein